MIRRAAENGIDVYRGVCVNAVFPLFLIRGNSASVKLRASRSQV